MNATWERRLRLDRVAREQRIDAATVDVELAWETRREVQRAVEKAGAAAALERLILKKLPVGDVAELTGLDGATRHVEERGSC